MGSAAFFRPILILLFLVKAEENNNLLNITCRHPRSHCPKILENKFMLLELYAV
jgi:hypothetical protein